MSQMEKWGKIMEISHRRKPPKKAICFLTQLKIVNNKLGRLTIETMYVSLIYVFCY